MTIALVVTGAVAMLTVSSELTMRIMYVIQHHKVVGFTPFGWIVTIAPVVIALAFSLGVPKMSAATAQSLFWTYSVLLGMSLSSVFLIYTGESIARLFFITSSVFAGMSIYGYTTQKDLTSFGAFFMMGLIGVLIASLANIFLKSTGLNFALSIVSVLIFVALTAFDTQRIKSVYNMYDVRDKEAATKIGVVGALTLYLDFINIFIHLIQIFGQRREE
jgi:hypothetical protein